MTDLWTMLYWIIGIIIFIILIDLFIYKPYKEKRRTHNLIKKLCSNNTEFYKILPKEKLDKGISIVLNDSIMLLGVLLIKSLRLIKCNLPIYVCYCDNDISEENINILKSIKDVYLFSITKIIGDKVIHKNQIKIYSLIYLPIKQIILLEPDILFFKNPEELFTDKLYIETGALFWNTRPMSGFKILDKKTYDWIRKIIPYKISNNYILNNGISTNQANGIIVFNKTNHLKTLEKLWTLINEWDKIHSYLDVKEYYWLACELAFEKYSFVTNNLGVIGQIQNDGVLCGHILYCDSKNDFLAWDGSLFEGKSYKKITEFTHYAISQTPNDWSSTENGIITAVDNKCIYGVEYIPLPDQLKSFINEYLILLQIVRKETLLV